jgi:hypothetical protein
MLTSQTELRKPKVNTNIKEKEEDHLRDFHQDTLLIKEAEPVEKTDSESKVEVLGTSVISRTNLTKISMRNPTIIPNPNYCINTNSRIG